MTIKDLQNLLKNNDLANIHFEDYYGNHKFSLSDYDIADIENYSDDGNIARLQLNIK